MEKEKRNTLIILLISGAAMFTGGLSANLMYGGYKKWIESQSQELDQKTRTKLIKHVKSYEKERPIELKG